MYCQVLLNIAAQLYQQLPTRKTISSVKQVDYEEDVPWHHCPRPLKWNTFSFERNDALRRKLELYVEIRKIEVREIPHKNAQEATPHKHERVEQV